MNTKTANFQQATSGLVSVMRFFNSSFQRQAMQIGEQIKRSVNKRHDGARSTVQSRDGILVSSSRYKRLEIEIDGVFAGISKVGEKVRETGTNRIQILFK